MREMAKETNLPMMLGAYRCGLGGLTLEAEEPVDEDIAAPNAAAGSQKHRRRQTCRPQITA